MPTKNDLRKEFYGLFEEEYVEGVNLCDAYDRAEKRYSEKYNHRMYSNFQSFNVARFNKTKRELKK
jgi:hypothetical protein